MPIRIYALAKQLKLDSKVLVDICTKAGVTGKGSALASLTDQELEKVTAFINSGKAARLGGPAKAPEGARTAAPPAALRREDYIPPGGNAAGRVPVLPPRPSKPPEIKKPPEAAPAPAAPPPVEPAPVVPVEKEIAKEPAKKIEIGKEKKVEKEKKAREKDGKREG